MGENCDGKEGKKGRKEDAERRREKKSRRALTEVEVEDRGDKDDRATSVRASDGS